MSTANDKLEQLREMKDTIEENFKTLKITAGIEVEIDKVRLDDEALKTPKLHNRWLMVLSEEAYTLKKLKNRQKKMELDRWKYWMGKQTDQYYAAYGMPHEKTIKADVEKYLDADDFIIEMDEIVTLQDQVVDFLERTVKDISNRGFAIKNAIDWRKFEAGS